LCLDVRVATVVAAQEVEQCRVHLVCVSPGNRVGAALDDHELELVDQVGYALAGLVQGEHLVRIPPNHQDGPGELGQVGAEVRRPCRDACHGGAGRGRGGD